MPTLVVDVFQPVKGGDVLSEQLIALQCFGSTTLVLCADQNRVHKQERIHQPVAVTVVSNVSELQC